MGPGLELVGAPLEVLELPAGLAGNDLGVTGGEPLACCCSTGMGSTTGLKASTSAQKSAKLILTTGLTSGGEVSQALLSQLPTTSHFAVTLQVAGSSTC